MCVWGVGGGRGRGEGQIKVGWSKKCCQSKPLPISLIMDVPNKKYGVRQKIQKLISGENGGGTFAKPLEQQLFLLCYYEDLCLNLLLHVFTKRYIHLFCYLDIFPASCPEPYSLLLHSDIPA